MSKRKVREKSIINIDQSWTSPLLHTLEGHNYSVVSLAVSNDGRLLFSASHDKTIGIWDLKNLKKVRCFRDSNSGFSTIAVTANGRVVASAANNMAGDRDHTIKIWNAQTGKQERSLIGHKAPIDALCITPDGRAIVSGSRDKTLKVWELKSGKELHTFTGHTHSVKCVALSKDGKLMVSGSIDFNIKVWDLKRGLELRTLSGHSSTVNAVVITPDGRQLISASGSVFLRHIARDGRRVIHRSFENDLKLWDLETGHCLITFKGHQAPVKDVGLLPDLQHMISVSYDGQMKLWNLSSNRELASWPCHQCGVEQVVVTPEYRAITATGEVSFMSHETGRPLRAYPDYSIKVWDLNPYLKSREKR
jgi:WD40 repeat protein